MTTDTLNALMSVENGIVAGAVPLLWDDGYDDPEPKLYTTCDRCGIGIYHADRDHLLGDTYWTDGEEIVCAACADEMADQEIGRYGEETA